MRTFYTDLNLRKNKLLNAVVHNLTTLDSGSENYIVPEAGQMGYYEGGLYIGVLDDGQYVWKKLCMDSDILLALGGLDGSHNVISISNYTAANNEYATKKIEFFGGEQTDGVISTASQPSDTLYLSRAVTASNPIVTHDDLTGIVGAMLYKRVVNGAGDLPTASTPNVAAGWTYIVGTAGNYAGKECEIGDMIIVQSVSGGTITFNVINGEDQVTNVGATITAGGQDETLATVDGVNITAKVNVTNGSATIASKSGNVITLKAGIMQSNNTGTVANSSGADITLAKVASTGNANELVVDSATYGGSTPTTNAQTALNNLAAALGNANIQIDGHVGNITTGNGLTDVASDGGSFGINIDGTNANGLYLAGSTEGSRTLAMHIASGADFGAVKVTAGNGLSISGGIVSYEHNTSAVTIASMNASTNEVTINGTLTPDASDAITASDAIVLKAVASTGAANELTVTSAIYGSGNATDNAQTAMTNLANAVSNGAKIWTLTNPSALSSQSNTWAISITGAQAAGSIVLLRDSTGDVDCGKSYSGNTVTLTFSLNANDTIASGAITAVILTPNSATAVA